MYPSLAIDCSDQFTSVAISDGSKIWCVEREGGRGQAREILVQIESGIADAGIARESLKSVCWAAGPGSFTGLRIATAVAQGLSYALDIPLIGISSLEAMAAAALATEVSECSSSNRVLSITDARMNEFYWAVFALDGSESSSLRPSITRLTADSLDSLESLITKLNAQGMKLNELRLVGSGSKALAESLENRGILSITPSAKNLFSLAEPVFAEKKYLTAIQAEPAYLRSKSAWKTLEQQNT